MAITTIPGATSSDLTTLKGTELADTFTLEGTNQFIDGLAGADTISAATGVESITVDAGADNDNVTLSGEANTVLLDLKGGNDSVTLADAVKSTINGGNGSDTITQTATRTFDDGSIFGRTGNDSVTLVNLKDSYIGGDQDDDTIISTGTVTNSTIRGGNQRDTITLAAAGGLIKGDNNEDTITVTGTATDLYVGGDGANDSITISSASVTGATIRGGAGADDINISGAALLVKGDKGNDDIDQTATNAKHTIFGGAGNDAIDASSTSNLLIMGDQATEDTAADGNDTITLTGIASSGAHTIMGGAGKDTITTAVGNSDERIDGGSGADVISGKAGQDTILGRAGADTINIEGANAAGTSRVVRAGADNDKIVFDNAAFGQLNINDTYAGENGTDTIALIGALANYDMSAIGSVAATSLDNVTAEIFALGSTSTNEATLAGTISHTFSAQAQTSGFRTFDATHTTTTVTDTHRVLNISAAAYTSAAGVTMSGSADKDVIVKLVGGSGADTLNDGAASDGAVDTLTGGAGIDTFNVSATTASTAITDLGVGGVSDIFTVSAAANGADIVTLGDYVATAATSNNKSLADVTLTVGNGFDLNMTAATGNFGFDIDGGDLASTLHGSAKADSINGGDAADSIVGNAGNDTIDGNGGSDTISGGAGDDTFTYASASSDQVAGDVIDGGTGTNVFSINAAAGASAASSAEFDMDNISNLLTFQTTGIGDDTENQTVVFSEITETTAQTVVVNASTLNSAGDSADLVVTNNAASATTLFNVTGGSGADTVTGSNGADTITGNDGADSLTGGAGADSLVGGAGADTLVGGTGNDVLSAAGAAATNDLTGGAGADKMTLSTGGAADQVFFLATTATAAATEAGTTAGTDVDFVTGSAGDTITAFVTSEDKIDFKDALLVNAKGTETDTLATIAAGGVVANTNVFVEITTAVGDATMGTAITQLNGLTTSAIEIGDAFVAFQNDGTNGYLYLVKQVSTADTIAAQDVTLLGQLAGVTDVNNGDFTTLS